MGSALTRTFRSSPPYTADFVMAKEQEAKSQKHKVDYMNLPCPVPYRDIHSDAHEMLTPLVIEGLIISQQKHLNDKFGIEHCVYMESMEHPHASGIIKVSTGDYEFSTFYNDPKLVMSGRIRTSGPVMTHLKYSFSNNFSCDINATLKSQPHSSLGEFLFDYKGKDYLSQFLFGNNGLYGANYIQSVTPNLALGTQLLWESNFAKSTIDFAAEYRTGTAIVTGRVSGEGSISLSYIGGLSEKVSLAAEFNYKFPIRDVTARFGYEFRSIDIVHLKENHKFGYGLRLFRDEHRSDNV